MGISDNIFLFLFKWYNNSLKSERKLKETIYEFKKEFCFNSVDLPL
jgi:hypothetical protein